MFEPKEGSICESCGDMWRAGKLSCSCKAPEKVLENEEWVEVVRSVQGAYNCYFFGGFGTPSAEKTFDSLNELKKDHETKIEEVLKDMPWTRKLVLYKQLYAEGIRIQTIDSDLRRELKKEFASQKKP